ncbi:MAG: 7-cyano-7-deazaguanine synthase [Candidatus Heimdallarchaeota archaeon]
MTHFYIEINPAKKAEEYKKVRNLFKDKFDAFAEIVTEEFILFTGDFIPENFQLNEESSTINFHTNKLVLPNFDNTKLLNREDDQYCPFISYKIEENELTIYTDPFGLYYIYIAVVDNSVILSSHLKYILDIHPEVLLKLDYDAIIEYLYGHTILANKTLFYDIKLLPYNTKLTIDLGKELELTNLLKKKEMWYEFPEDYKIDANIEEKVEELSKLFRELLEYTLKGNEKTKLSFLLSGGLDSTLLISAISKKNKDKIRALTFDSKLTGKEATTAKKVSELLNIEHHIETVDEMTVVENCYKHLWTNEGLSYNIASVLFKLLEKYPLKNQIYIDGFAGDAQFGGEFLSNIEKITKLKQSKIDKCQKISSLHDYTFPKKSFLSLINENHTKIELILNNGFKLHINNFWNTENETLFLESMLFFIRVRHYTLGGTRTCMDFAPIIMPFYHPRIFSAYITVPPKFRKKRKLEKRILSKLNKDISEQSSVSTIWYNRFASSFLIQFGLKIARKMEGIVKRRLIPIYSTLPYNEWLRNKNEYYNMIRDIFDENSLIWNILDRTNTMKLFADFLNRKNHLHKFIMHIVDLEIILRLFYIKFDIKGDIKMISSSLSDRKDFYINLNFNKYKN